MQNNALMVNCKHSARDDAMDYKSDAFTRERDLTVTVVF